MLVPSVYSTRHTDMCVPSVNWLVRARRLVTQPCTASSPRCTNGVSCYLSNYEERLELIICAKGHSV